MKSISFTERELEILMIGLEYVRDSFSSIDEIDVLLAKVTNVARAPARKIHSQDVLLGILRGKKI